MKTIHTKLTERYSEGNGNNEDSATRWETENAR